MMQKLLLTAAVAALVVAAMPIQASHESHEIAYISVGGDVQTLCLEEELGYCLGGAIFETGPGNFIIAVHDEDPLGLGDFSGAYRVEPGGETADVCFPVTVSVPSGGGTIGVFLDGVVYWALGQPCGTGTLSQSTTGTITATHA